MIWLCKRCLNHHGQTFYRTHARCPWAGMFAVVVSVMVWLPRIVFGTTPLHGQSSQPPCPYVKRWPCSQATLAICQNWMPGKNVCWTRVGSWASVELHSRFHERPWHSSRRLYTICKVSGGDKAQQACQLQAGALFWGCFQNINWGTVTSWFGQQKLQCSLPALSAGCEAGSSSSGVQAPWHFVCGSLLACGCSKSCAPFIKLPVPLPKLCFAQATREVRSFTILSMAAAQSSFTWQWQHATGPSLKWHHRAGKEPFRNNQSLKESVKVLEGVRLWWKLYQSVSGNLGRCCD